MKNYLKRLVDYYNHASVVPFLQDRDGEQNVTKTRLAGLVNNTTTTTTTATTTTTTTHK